MPTESTELTQLLAKAADGDAQANEALFETIYPTLRKLARSQLNSHRRGTVCTTELVHEASMRLIGADHFGQLDNGGHLMALAARAMRQILIDHARKKHSQKRGGDLVRIDLDESQHAAEPLPAQILALEPALAALGNADARALQVVELKFFSGCTIEEIAEILDISAGTVKSDWRKSRAFLYAEMALDD